MKPQLQLSMRLIYKILNDSDTTMYTWSLPYELI